MIPTIIQLTKNLEISTFGLMLGLAFYIGFLLFESELKKFNKDPELAYKLLLAIIPSAIVGAKLFYVFKEFEKFRENPASIIFTGSGLSFYGGFILAILATFAVTTIIKENFLKIADIIAPSILIGYSIGKFGTHLAGFSYGIATDSFLGVAYPNGYAPISDTVMPTSLFEMLLAFIFFAIIMKIRTLKLPQGSIFSAAIVLNSISFFLLNFLTTEENYISFMTLNQVMCLITFLLIMVIYFAGIKRNKKTV